MDDLTAHTDFLVTQALEHLILQDKRRDQPEAAIRAEGGYAATITALAHAMGGTEADAVDRVLSAMPA